MNKAFVKDDDTWEDPKIELDPQLNISAGSHNFMTRQGKIEGSENGGRIFILDME